MQKGFGQNLFCPNPFFMRTHQQIPQPYSAVKQFILLAFIPLVLLPAEGFGWNKFSPDGPEDLSAGYILHWPIHPTLIYLKCGMRCGSSH